VLNFGARFDSVAQFPHAIPDGLMRGHNRVKLFLGDNVPMPGDLRSGYRGRSDRRSDGAQETLSGDICHFFSFSRVLDPCLTGLDELWLDRSSHVKYNLT
jgi:hypothetical protein